MTTFEIFKTLHIVFAAVWFGSGIMVNFLMGLLGRSNEAAAVGGIAGKMKQLGRYFDTAVILTLLTGIATIEATGSYGYADPFVIAGYVGVIASSGIAHGVIHPTVDRLHAAFEAGQLDQLEPLGKKVGQIATLDSVLLLVVITLMVVRP